MKLYRIVISGKIVQIKGIQGKTLLCDEHNSTTTVNTSWVNQLTSALSLCKSSENLKPYKDRMVFLRDNCSTLISWHADIDSLNFDAFSISLFNKKTRFSILQRNPENYTNKKKWDYTLSSILIVHMFKRWQNILYCKEKLYYLMYFKCFIYLATKMSDRET